MAEKEERIAIIKWNTKDDICPAPTELQCGGAKSCEECKVGISRQEAIDIIAKSLCQSEGWPCKECRYEKDNASCQTCLEVELYKQYAEAALNALLQ